MDKEQRYEYHGQIAAALLAAVVFICLGLAIIALTVKFIVWLF